MVGYFGTEIQQRLQVQAEAAVDFIATTRGACQNGRMMGCDDIDAFGRDRIEQVLARDRVCGFRLIPADRVDELRSWLGDRGFRFDTWDVFVADREVGLAAVDAVLEAPLPEGLRRLESPKEAESIGTSRLQSLMASCGIVPFSGTLLTGGLGPAVTVSLGRDSPDPVATAHGYMPHNSMSNSHRYAWGGLVAVDPAERGKGLGKHVNALMVAHVFRHLGAEHVYELVSSSNVASKRMVEACGLRLEPTLVCGAASPVEGARFTR